jgi:hypothetical protein
MSFDYTKLGNPWLNLNWTAIDFLYNYLFLVKQIYSSTLLTYPASLDNLQGDLGYHTLDIV